MYNLDKVPTHERAEDHDEVEHIPRLLEVVQLKCGDLDNGFQTKDSGENKV